MGNAYHSLGENQKAIELHEEALAIAREIGDRQGEGLILFNISIVLDEIGDRAQATDYAKSALKILEQIESPFANTVRRQLAEWQG
jgi:tetratricopeptide (TPR) repeat protein